MLTDTESGLQHAALASSSAPTTANQLKLTFTSAYHTDIGIKKSVNQDSLLVMEAQMDSTPIFFAAICDGMGGLMQGEVASATVCKALSDWFQGNLPALLAKGFTEQTLKQSLTQLIEELNQRILNYNVSNNITMGTTLSALLLIDNRYYTVHVGDSRIYYLSNLIQQITKDHTLVQLEVDQGKISAQQAAKDSRRNVLLRCVGASPEADPEFNTGVILRDSLFMLCSDGFRHQISEQEFWDYLNPLKLTTEEQLQKSIVELTELNKSRGEKDNISVIAVKVS